MDIFHFESKEQNQSDARKVDDILATEYETVALKEIPRDSSLKVSETELKMLCDNHFHDNTIISHLLEDKCWSIGISHSELPTENKYKKLKETIIYQTNHLHSSSLTKELLKKERNKTIDQVSIFEFRLQICMIAHTFAKINF